MEMESSHGEEEGDEGSLSIWARVGVDWKGRSKKNRKRQGKTLAWMEPLSYKKYEQEKGRGEKSPPYIESEGGSHN